MPPGPSRARTRLFIHATALSVIATTVASATAATVAEAASPPSRFVSVAPCRLVDTRTTGGPVAAGGTIDVAVVSSTCGVPAGANAAAVTITVADADAPGFVTAWPTGSTKPTTSSVNYRADATVANSQLLQVGTNGRISLYTLAAADLIVDVTGYFVPAPSSVRAGRFVPVAAERLIDTRDGTRPGSGGVVRVDPDLPDGASAVAVNIATAVSSGPGFFTAYAAGTMRPNASVLNTDAADQTRSTAAIVPVSDQGFEIYTSRGDHVIVDITGYFTDDSADQSTAGRFVGTVPVRLVDTRLAAGAAGGPRLWDRGSRDFAVSAIIGGPAAAVSANVTMVQTEDKGYLTALPARVTRPLTSSVNAEFAQQVVANSAIVELSTAGVRFTTLEATHLVVDITGWFTGNPIEAGDVAAVNTPPADRKVTIITDSAMAGVRWNGALAGLQGFQVDHRMESCRRLVQFSCRGREGYAPPNVVSEIAGLPAVGPEDLLVIATGYDDWWERFSSDFDVVVAAARNKGFHHIVWVTFRSNVPYGLQEYYARMNDVMRSKVASGDYPEVRIWDYEAYTAGVSGWFASDGIHLTTLGAWGSADWISRHVRAFDDRPCPQPLRPGETPADPCPDPETLPQTVGYPDIRGIYSV